MTDPSSILEYPIPETAVIRLNRPAAMNALNSELRGELTSSLNSIEKNEQVRTVVITGVGKAFAAGVDIKEISTLTPRQMLDYSRETQNLFMRVERFPKPIIAGINGLALGGGCELALACAIRIAGQKAKMGFPEINLGTIPGGGATQRLARLVGRGLALELLLTGRNIAAEEAAQKGLVNKIVPDAEIEAACLELAKELNSKAPVALKMILEAVSYGNDVEANVGMQMEQFAVAITCSTHDFREGLTSFAERRKPVFTGQ